MKPAACNGPARPVAKRSASSGVVGQHPKGGANHGAAVRGKICMGVNSAERGELGARGELGGRRDRGERGELGERASTRRKGVNSAEGVCRFHVCGRPLRSSASAVWTAGCGPDHTPRGALMQICRTPPPRDLHASCRFAARRPVSTDRADLPHNGAGNLVALLQLKVDPA